MSFTSVVLLGHYTQDGINPSSGTVEAVLSAEISDGSTILRPGVVETWALDSNGTVGAVIVSTTDSSTVPQGVGWKLIELIQGAAPNSYSVIVPNSGATVISGTGAPSSGTGSNGEFYVNTLTGQMYGPKAAGSWPSTVVNLQNWAGSVPSFVVLLATLTPASTSQLYSYIPTSAEGAPNGVATLDGSGHVPASQLANGVTSVFGRVGAVTAEDGDYTVSQVTGAAPLVSPALTGTPTAPTATALTDDTQVATTGYTDAAVAVEASRAEAAEALLAPLVSPALTGTPTAPTATALTDDTQVATTGYTDAAVAVEASRAEAAEALLAPLVSPALTGTPTAPTATALTDDTQVATTGYTDAAVLVETNRAETAEALALQKANNLSDVADAGSSRWHLSASALSSAAAVATSNVSLSAPGAAIDGYSLQSNDEVLLTAQSTPSQNGIWLWSGAASALVRPNEFPSGGLVKRGRTVAVVNGTLGANTQWLLAASAAGLTIDTTAQTWTRVGTGTYAPLASPALTGTPTAPTATALTDDTQVATTGYTDAAVLVETNRAETAEALALQKSNNLSDLASASTARTNLGLGSIAVLSAPSGTVVGTTDTQTLSNKRITRRINSTTSSATPAINTDTTDQFEITALATAITSMTSSLTGSPNDGDHLIVRIKDNGSAQTIAWGSSFVERGSTLPTTTVSGKYLYVGFIYNSTASVWDCIAVAQEF